MSNDIHLAFAHPAARAAATADAAAGEAPRDRISLRDYTRAVEIGAFQVERGTTQRVQFNVVVEVMKVTAPLGDDVDRVLSYDTITEAIDTELAAERLNLLETLAERVAERILTDPRAARVFVRIEKLDRAPGALGVEIVRSRAAPRLQPVPATPEPQPQLHPRLAYLGNAVISGEQLTAWLDALAALPAPVILCVGLPDAACAQSTHALAQRRIDLLAIEQNAWVLAGRDRRCVVVSTRTELDWAMKQGHMSVWAPSKLVLDAHEGPGSAPAPTEATALALWLADRFDACDLVVIGAKAPQGTTTQIRVFDPDNPAALTA